jgi:hypothetical protein
MGTTLMEDPPRKPAKGTTLIEPPVAGTRLVMPGDPAGQAAGAAATAAAPQPLDGPVVGWLVVVEGPGRGQSVKLGYGMNIIGRGAGNRVRLDFGDDQISGDDHFRLAYDGAHRKFHLVPGRGANLVYVGDAPLLTPVELTAGAELKVGATRLRFVPLCGADWDWGIQDA